MILPSKHVRIERSLLGVGAEILRTLDRPQTMAALWDKMRQSPNSDERASALNYSWFILALDLLFMLGLVAFRQGLIQRVSS